MPAIENLVYYIFNVLSLGGLWLVKIVIKKAIMESKGNESKRVEKD